MIIDDIKPLGAFIENSIRPLIEEMKWIFEELDKRGIPVNAGYVKDVLKYLSNQYLKFLISDTIKSIICIGLICFTIWKIHG